MIESRRISVVNEKRIITGLITSTQFCKEIIPMIDLDYFTNSYLKTVAEWCVVFYEEHKKAPNLHIKDIFESESCRLKETDSELIENLLKILSDQYDPENINVDYIKDCAVDYFRRRELEIVVNNISVLKEQEDYDAAEEEITKFKKVFTSLDSGHIINLGNLDQIAEIYRQREEEDKKFFKLPGDLGRYLGNFKRGDVVGYYAPAKRGKSFTLVDHFKHAVLQKRKAIFWSIEMTKTEITPRIIKAFHPMVDEEGDYDFPAFDCKRNQTGECIDRESTVVVLEDDEIIQDPTHKVCTKCMHGGPHKYEMAIYKDTIYRDADDIFTIRKKFGKSKRSMGIEDILGKYGRLIVHKKYTLTYDKMLQDIERLEAESGFIPDVFIIDYVDILDIGSKFDDYRKVDEAWKMMARLAGEFNALVITATQANKEGHKAENLDATHQGGFYGKNQHVNLMCGLNQKPIEKEQGIMRFGISEARSQHFIPGVTCTVLVDLKAGQSYLDSYYN